MMFKKKKNNDMFPVDSSSESKPTYGRANGDADIHTPPPMQAEDIDLTFNGSHAEALDGSDNNRLPPIISTDAEPVETSDKSSGSEISETSGEMLDETEILLKEAASILGLDVEHGAEAAHDSPAAVPTADNSSGDADFTDATAADNGSADLLTAADGITEESEADTPEECEDGSSHNASEAEEEEEEEKKPLNDFEASLRDFSESDTDSELKPSQKKFDIIRSVIFVACIVICAISTTSLIHNIYDKIRGEQIYGEIIDSVADGFNMDGNVENNGGKIDLLSGDKNLPYTPTMDDIIKNGITEVATPSDYSAELARMRASLESLRNINPEIYAWIKIPGTNINYPVAKTDNNDYYLDHAYTGEDLVNGSIYADFRCQSPITDNYNTVLYGHNITSGSMFNHVSKFFDEEVFNNTLIYLYTFDGIYIYKPFSIHEAEYDSGYVDVGFTPEEFVEFANELAELSDIPSDVEFVPSDSLLTLSTCTNGIATRRYALHAVLIEAITE